MPSSLQSPADIVNDALTRLGYKDRVGSLYEGSKASKKALDIYGQTRDTMLRDGQWPFARRDIAATPVKSAPVGGYFPPNVYNPNVNPPPPWLYEYTYPDDCLEVRAVRPAPILIPNFNPRPHIFAIANDSGEQVILSNVNNALITYTGQVTDMTDWPPDFTEAFCAALARRLAPVLATSPDVLKMEPQDEAFETQSAQRQQG